MSDESHFLHKESCPKCGSRDNLARYSDGHAYCFGCEYWEPGEGQDESHRPARRKPMSADLIHGEVRALAKRGITAATCQHFGYMVGTHNGTTYQIAPYYKDGELVAQHLRTASKDFSWRGDSKNLELFGQHLWRDGGKKVVITEGEIDCMTVSQLQDNKWPVVSVPNGAQSAKKYIAKNIDWLNKFETVVLMFDNDEPGKDAINECAPLFRPGACKVARLDLKDANDMLLAGRGGEVIKAIWDAREYRPDGLVSVDEILEEIKKPIVQGIPWFLPSLTAATYGRRPGELYGFGAGTGVGKTDFLTQQIAFDVAQLGEKVGCLFLETPVVELGKRIAGKLAAKQFHIPDADWTQEELEEAIEQMRGKVTMYDSFGQADWEVVKGHIRYMAVALGIRIIYLDHLTALADPDDERGSLEKLMGELAGMSMELGIIMHYVSHLATPDGTPHEEGGRVTIRHFKGARAIGFWTHFMFGLERNQQAEDPEERLVTTFRVLKDRYTGRATGKVFRLVFNLVTGQLSESAGDSAPNPMVGTAADFDDDIPF